MNKESELTLWRKVKGYIMWRFVLLVAAIKMRIWLYKLEKKFGKPYIQKA